MMDVILALYALFNFLVLVTLIAHFKGGGWCGYQVLFLLVFLPASVLYFGGKYFHKFMSKEW
ncbi:TMhelix containing protein [Vibrio phage 1.170.O._10N.261.52.C3]|nr:TMhelix containing protein [Vibrio phage 1.170.O._10N.261.52.C3]